MTAHTVSFLIFLITLITQFLPSTVAENNSNYRSSWNYDDGNKRCGNICIIVFVLIAVIFVTICACGIFKYLNLKKKEIDDKNKKRNLKTRSNSTDDIMRD